MKFYGQLYTNELDYICEVDKFLERHKLPKLTFFKVENLNKFIMSCIRNEKNYGSTLVFECLR